MLNFHDFIQVYVFSTNHHLKGSYDKQNLALVVISDEIYVTRQRLVS